MCSHLLLPALIVGFRSSSFCLLCQLDETQADASLISPSELSSWYLNDLHALSLSEFTWHRLRVQGDLPPPRLGHTLAGIGNCLLLFGGWPHANNCRNVHTSSSNCNKKTVSSSDGAKMRTNDRGGCSTDEDAAATAAPSVVKEAPDELAAAGAAGAELLQPLPLLSAAALCSYTGEWMPVLCKGRPPAFRYGHSCTPTPQGLILIGGWTSPAPQMEVLIVENQGV